MKVRFLLLIFALALVVGMSSHAQAAFINLGFENGSTGWDFFDPTGGSAGNNVLASPANYHNGITIGTYLPPEGVAYLELHPDGPGNSEVAAQSAFYSSAGQTVSAVAAFDGVDFRRDAAYNPSPTGIYGDDAAYVEIYRGQWTAQQISNMTQVQRALNLFDIPWERRIWGPSGGAIPVTDYLAVGDFTSDPWTPWASDALGTGWYTLSYRIVTGPQPASPDLLLESILKSHSLHDINVIPEAGTSALWGLGLGLLALMRYRRRNS